MSKYAENHEEMLLDKLRRYIDTEEYKYEAPYITKGDVEVIIHALEKQIPKKPKKIEAEGYRYTDAYRCSNCGGNFSGTGIANYCYHCGQKLDWSDAD